MSMKCILIKIKFDIDVNNNELLKTIWKHKEKIKYLIVIGSAAAQSLNLSMCLVDLSLCAHAYSKKCVVHFHPFAASIEIAQGANIT